MANINIGNKSEQDLALLLAQAGYWVHIFARGKGGSQPCDIIAINGKDSTLPYSQLLLDAKHSEEPTFNFRRIEANQITCFKLADSCGIECGFAIDYNGTWYYLSYKYARARIIRKIKSVDIVRLPKLDNIIG